MLDMQMDITQRLRERIAAMRLTELEDALSECEFCERSLLVSEAEAEEMERSDPETARPAGAVKLLVCGHCWDELARERNALAVRVKELEAELATAKKCPVCTWYNYGEGTEGKCNGDGIPCSNWHGYPDVNPERTGGEDTR